MSRTYIFDSSGLQTDILQEKLVNTAAADALVPLNTGSSAATALSI